MFASRLTRFTYVLMKESRSLPGLQPAREHPSDTRGCESIPLDRATSRRRCRPAPLESRQPLTALFLPESLRQCRCRLAHILSPAVDSLALRPFLKDLAAVVPPGFSGRAFQHSAPESEAGILKVQGQGRSCASSPQRMFPRRS